VKSSSSTLLICLAKAADADTNGSSLVLPRSFQLNPRLPSSQSLRSLSSLFVMYIISKSNKDDIEGLFFKQTIIRWRFRARVCKRYAYVSS